jgi:sterol desaturase/sphingolipid hydroxylase (fatty acid hydroxylase superfamily)
MEWTQDARGYYLDFVVVPLLMLVTLWTSLHYRGPSVALPVMALAFFAVWTLIEYWIHRTLFHHMLRREHWLHHKRPRGYVSAPWYLTAILHLLVLGGTLGSGGLAYGAGMFLGLEAGYLTYIVVHDRIHHGPRRSAYIALRAALHDAHHTYASEKNFGVASSFWDHVFGTYYLPKRP